MYGFGISRLELRERSQGVAREFCSRCHGFPKFLPISQECCLGTAFGRPQSQMSHMTTTKSEATTENLHLYEGWSIVRVREMFLQFPTWRQRQILKSGFGLTRHDPFCLSTGMTDRGKAYTDVLAGTLVLLNSFVMLIELEIEGYAAVTRGVT